LLVNSVRFVSLTIEAKFAVDGIVIRELEIVKGFVSDNFPVMREENVIESTIRQASRIGVEPFVIFVRNHLESGIEEYLERLIIFVAVHVPLARRKSCVAAAGRNCVEVSEKEHRRITEPLHLGYDTEGLLGSILRIVRMQMRVAYRDDSVSQEERREREAAVGKKVNLAGKQIVYLAAVEYLQLTEQKVFISESGKSYAVRYSRPKSADNSVVISLAELAGYSVAQAEHAVEYFLKPDYIEAMFVEVDPFGYVVGISASVMQQSDAFSLFHRYLRKQIGKLRPLAAMSIYSYTPNGRESAHRRSKLGTRAKPFKRQA